MRIGSFESFYGLPAAGEKRRRHRHGKWRCWYRFVLASGVGCVAGSCRDCSGDDGVLAAWRMVYLFAIMQSRGFIPLKIDSEVRNRQNK